MLGKNYFSGTCFLVIDKKKVMADGTSDKANGIKEETLENISAEQAGSLHNVFTERTLPVDSHPVNGNYAPIDEDDDDDDEEEDDLILGDEDELEGDEEEFEVELEEDDAIGEDDVDEDDLVIDPDDDDEEDDL